MSANYPQVVQRGKVCVGESALRRVAGRKRGRDQGRTRGRGVREKERKQATERVDKVLMISDCE